MCRAFEEVKKEGIEQGIEQGKIDTAIKLIKMNLLTLADISKASDLPLEKIEQLQRELKE